ncbi:hypothetical protein [Staphylococcus phage PT1-4]
MITLLVIIFIVSMIVMKIRETKEEKRESDTRHFGEEFANKEYYRKIAQEQVRQEDIDNGKFWSGSKDRLKRINQRAQELAEADKNK